MTSMFCWWRWREGFCCCGWCYLAKRLFPDQSSISTASSWWVALSWLGIKLTLHQTICFWWIAEMVWKTRYWRVKLVTLWAPRWGCSQARTHDQSPQNQPWNNCDVRELYTANFWTPCSPPSPAWSSREVQHRPSPTNRWSPGNGSPGTPSSRPPQFPGRNTPGKVWNIVSLLLNLTFQGPWARLGGWMR